MSDRSGKSQGVSRRRFVAVMAAGSAALLARPLATVAAAAAPAKPRGPSGATPRPAAPAMSAAQRKEYERQRKATADAVAVIRAHAMPPGTEMASVFRVRRPARKEG
jgi:hypothetical protein